MNSKVLFELPALPFKAVSICTDPDYPRYALGGVRIWNGGIEATDSKVFVRLYFETEVKDPIVVKLDRKVRPSHNKIAFCEDRTAQLFGKRSIDLAQWSELEGKFPKWESVVAGKQWDLSCPQRVSGVVLAKVAGVTNALDACLEYVGGAEECGPYYARLRRLPTSEPGWDSGEILWMGLDRGRVQ